MVTATATAIATATSVPVSFVKTSCPQETVETATSCTADDSGVAVAATSQPDQVQSSLPTVNSPPSSAPTPTVVPECYKCPLSLTIMTDTLLNEHVSSAG